VFFSGLEKLGCKSASAERWGDAVAEVASEVPEEVIQLMANAAAADDDTIEKAVEHGVRDFFFWEVLAEGLVGELLEVLFVRHAFRPEESVPRRVFVLPCLESFEEGLFVVWAELADFEE